VTERKKKKRDAPLRPQESSLAESDDEPNVRSNQKPIIENPYEEEEKNPGKKQRPKSVMRPD